MFISNLKIDGFKNLSSVDIDTDKNVNIICGDNAQGKTNLLESIFVFEIDVKVSHCGMISEDTAGILRFKM